MCDMIIMNNEHIYIQRLKLRFYFIKREIRKGVKRLHTHKQSHLEILMRQTQRKNCIPYETFYF